ncbi:J domain-containing protein [Pseudohalioglobus sediminis]|uniref:J domain-containing protein n=1 Tax=Pseudohalioglobus sediminis TaxID=2606449 RepID=A0A5B0WPA5_9GAMM|nr:J domain-containing protein [Pseudohalioglobus sediminis]KAA1188914.1 J domain-containing protein [Pseudohalioglobus sediminis]
MRHIPELLFLALDYYRYPSPYDERRSTAPLPPGVGELLAAPSHCLSDDNIEQTAADLAVDPDDCRNALVRYIELLLFTGLGDDHRVLGVPADADAAQIRQHYQRLQQLFALDWGEASTELAERHAQRVETAWAALGEPAEPPVEAAAEPAAEPADEAPPEPTPAPAVQAPKADVTAAPAPPVVAQATDTDAPGNGSRGPLPYAAVALVLVLAGGWYLFDRTSELTVSSVSELQRPPGTAVPEPGPEPEPEPDTRADTGDSSEETQAPEEVVLTLDEPAPVESAAIDGVVGLASAADSATDSNAVALVEPQSDVAPITDAELSELLRAFTTHYRAMDAAAFTALFAADAQTPDAQGSDVIRAYFQRVFAGVRIQGLQVTEVNWEPGAAPRRGWARMDITGAPRRRGQAQTLAASIDFEIDRGADGALQITRMIY